MKFYGLCFDLHLSLGLIRVRQFFKNRRHRLTGLEAISASNGWSMAVLGISIVFSGLVVLSLAISQLKKIVDLLEKKETGPEQKDAPAGEPLIPPEDFPSPKDSPEDIHETALRYKPLFEKLGDTFQLSELYRLSQAGAYPHPHLTIKTFRQVQILTPVGDGNFKWHLTPPA